MNGPPDMVWQPSLLDVPVDLAVDDSFSDLTRTQLDPRSWVDYQPGWVRGSDELFDHLVSERDWGQRRRKMYDRTVEEPRLTSLWRLSSGQPLEPPILEEMRRILSERYDVTLDSVGFNLYRDGRDSVAWHGDRISKEIEEPLVVLVSLGHPRRFLLRPSAGGPSRSFELGRGDLLVTGGRTQRDWQHSVPKVATAGPRISIAFRHRLDPAVYDQSDATSPEEEQP
jgi:alkylated DNA repair dioxygenase AlkB